MADWPFTLGVEIELPLTDQKGIVLSGDRLVSVWNSMFKGAHNVIKTMVNQAPPDIKSKIKGVTVKSKNRHGKKIDYVCIQYVVAGKTIEVDAFGPDPNISQITWILELVTPPCKSPDELLWWISSLSKAARQSLPNDIKLVPIGFLPSEKEYRSGITFSNHIHIGIPDEMQKYKIYNLFRVFVPHHIGLSVNSPFINEMPLGDVKIKDDRTSPILVISNNSPRSVRLLHNKGQLGPVDKDKYIPHLRSGSASQLRKYFDQKVQRMEPDDRYCDVFPFTPYGTIEIRIFDCQPSALRLTGLACLVQMLAERALKMGNIPEVKGEGIVSNREKAVEYGLFGKFFSDESFNDASFDKLYSYEFGTSKPIRKLFSGVQTLLLSLWPEMKNRQYEKYLSPLFLTTFGNSTVAFPMTPADYWLYVYQSKGQKWGPVEKILFDLFDKYYVLTDSDPLVDAFGQADYSQFSPDEGVKQLDLTNIPEKQQQKIDASRKKFDLSSSADTATTTTAPVRLNGSITIKTSKMGPDEEFGFNARVQSSSPLTGKYIVMVRLIEKDQTGENILNSAMGTFTGQQLSNISNSHLSIKFSIGAFKGTKNLIANLIVKDGDGVELLDTRSTNTVQVTTLPNFRITPNSSFPKAVKSEAVINAGFKFQNMNPELKIKKYKIKILFLGANNEPLSGNEKEISSSSKPIDFAMSQKLDKQFKNLEFVKVKAQVLIGNKLIAEYLSGAINIQKEEEPSKEKIMREKQKPKVRVSPSLSTPVVKPQATTPQVRASVQPRATVQSRTTAQPKAVVKTSTTSKASQDKARLEREKKEKQKAEAERLKRERQAKEKREKEQKEAAKKEKERLEREKKEREKREKEMKAKAKAKAKAQEAKPKVLVRTSSLSSSQGSQKAAPQPAKPRSTPTPVKANVRSTVSTSTYRPPAAASVQRATMQKPRGQISAGFKFEFKMKKAEAPLNGSHSTQIRIETPKSNKLLVLIISYYSINGQKYVIKARPFKSGDNVKESASVSLSKLPCGSEFCYLAEIYDQTRVIASDSSDRVVIIEKNLHKLVSISGSLGSNAVIPNSMVVVKMRLKVNKTPRPVGVTFRASLTSSNGVINETESRITVGGIDAPNEYHHFFAINSGSFSDSVGQSGKINVDAYFDENSAKIYSKSFSVQFYPKHAGLMYEQAGYADSRITMNALTFIMAHIKNNTRMEYSGNLVLNYVHPNGGLYPVFRRKIKKIAPGNYEKEAERVLLPPIFGGIPFKVISTANLKCKTDGSSFVFEGLSRNNHQGDNSRQKSLEVNFKGIIGEGIINSNFKMPIEIRAKLNSGTAYKDLRMVVIANYGNVIRDVIKTIKIKEARVIETSNVVWKVRDYLGFVSIEAEFYQGNIKVPELNTDVRSIKYFVFPDKLREKS